MTITPLDTCGMFRLEGELYRRVKESGNPLTEALIDSYRVWLNGQSDEGRSSILSRNLSLQDFCEACFPEVLSIFSKSPNQ